MLVHCHVLVDGIVLRTDSNVLKDLHNALVDLFVEDLHAARCLRESGSYDVESG